MDPIRTARGIDAGRSRHPARYPAGRVYLLTGDEDTPAGEVPVLVRPVRPAQLDALLG